MPEDIRDFIKTLNKSYTIPAMLSKILAVIKDEDSPPEELYRLISHDQAFAERVIVFANSAIFGHSGQIRDIKHAILFLGYEKIKSIALTMAVMDIFPSVYTTFNIKNLWIHGYEVAYIAAAIADLISMAAPREVFLCGLLHDIGRIIFYRNNHDKFFQIGTDEDIFEKEKALYGCTHADAGAWYAEYCNMPEDIVLSILYHHRPSLTTGNRLGVAIVSLAEALSRRFSPRIEDDGLWTSEHDAIILELELSDDDLSSIEQKLGSIKREIERFFK
jgi:putative nucleotidyltransferase with HDIG domain